MIRPPTQEQIQRLIAAALAEDVGSGDITTANVLQGDPVAAADMTAKEPLVLCGLEIARAVFLHLDPGARFDDLPFADGDAVAAGSVVFRVRARTRALLEGERVALNLLQRLSGIATLTRKYVDQASPVTILDTRKTTPGLRVFEKYAVRMGGGTNHRFGLYDAVLIKDNHIRHAGSIAQAVKRVRERAGAGVPVEVETTCREEVKEALAAGADTLLLDNMPPAEVQAMVALVGGRAKTEVSGGVTLDKLAELSATGVDFISVGALTHSAPAVDISMNFL